VWAASQAGGPRSAVGIALVCRRPFGEPAALVVNPAVTTGTLLVASGGGRALALALGALTATLDRSRERILAIGAGARSAIRPARRPV
jgi:hypothetical protein